MGTPKKVVVADRCFICSTVVAKKEKINVKKILAVINATFAVAKRKPEKIRLAGRIRTLTSAIPGFESRQA